MSEPAMTQSSLPTVDRKRQLFAARPSPGTLATIVVPLLIAAGTAYVAMTPHSYWDRFHGLALAFAGTVYIAVLVRGRLRDAMVVIASLLLCLAAFEVYSITTYVTTIDINAPDHSVSRAPLGWGPGHPGIFHHKKVDSTGRVLLEVDYTIDEHLHRRVLSADDAPTIAFAGGSVMFGSGISDADTLPQAFADATARRLHVVNLAFSGYGPQQTLRGLELGVFDDVITQPKLFIVQTGPAYIERTACITADIDRAPRYELVDGQPVFRGKCIGRWPLPMQALVAFSSLYRVFVEPELEGAQPAKIDLFVAVMARTGALVREKYGVPTVVLYLRDNAYMGHTGYTDDQLIRRLRDGGLIVIDGTLDIAAFPGQNLYIPGDGHPTGVANRAWAALVKNTLRDIEANAH